MLEFGRKISYLSEWKYGMWESGYGYLKTSVRENQGRMELFFEKDLKGKSVNLGFYRVKDDELHICMVQKECKAVYEFVPQDVEGVPLDGIDGVLMKCGGRIFSSEWSEKAFDYEKAKEVDSFQEVIIEKAPEKQEEKELTAQEIPDFLRVKKKPKVSKIKYDKSYYMKINDWKDLFKKHDGVEPFSDDELFGCVEIGYDDLKFLPSSCHALINNSFLLHAMYCYGHVLLGHRRCKRRQKLYVLGVPGRYERSECLFAGMFGFEQFKKGIRKGVCDKDFGYWCISFCDDRR